MIEKFDKLRKYITTEEGKKLAKELRNMLVRNEKYAEKIDRYFADTMDGMEPSKAAKEAGLLS